VYRLDRLGFNSDEAVYAGQAASIAHVKSFVPYFPIYRAHPLLLQTALSIIYRYEVSDFAARLFAVVVGLATVLFGFAIGRALYGRTAGLISAGLLAIMPYHVVLSRQVLLDGAEALFGTIALYALSRYALSQEARWMYAAAAAFGLAFLSKETAVILVIAACTFLALSPQIGLRLRNVSVAAIVLGAMVAVYPVAIAFGGASRTGRSFFVWQLVRPPNHSFSFYFTTVFPDVGLLVVVAALAGLVALWRERTWRETLLLSWILVPVGFFTLWPTKGYQYLVPIAPAVAVLAGRALARPLSRERGTPMSRSAGAVAILVIIATLAASSWSDVSATPRDTFLAGSGGVAGGREAGTWLRGNLPPEARLLALGPSMANILQFYGAHKVWGLSVSTDAQHRNPVYQPLANPDLALRRGEIQYLVWDSYSARRSPTFAAQLLRYVARFHGEPVHTEFVTRGTNKQPVITIYAVRP
jgi:4-amino-4-deoxy-L-arabinose transferase-like glycosyltransferase